MLRTIILIFVFMLNPGVFCVIWRHCNYDYNWGGGYDSTFLILNCLWDFFWLYQVYRFFRWLLRLLVRLISWLGRILWALICRVYYHCRARADKRGETE